MYLIKVGVEGECSWWFGAEKKKKDTKPNMDI